MQNGQYSAQKVRPELKIDVSTTKCRGASFPIIRFSRKCDVLEFCHFPKPQSAIPQFRSPLQLITRPSLALMQNCYFGTCLFFESSPSGDDAKLIFRKHLNKNTNWGEWNGFGPIRVSSTPKSTPQSGIFGPLGMSPEVFF